MAHADPLPVDSHRKPRRWALVALVALVIVAMVAAVFWREGAGSDEVGAGPPESPGVEYSLPLGLERVPGTSSLGRPMVIRHGDDASSQQEVDEQIQVRALYEVDSADAEAAYRAWMDQISSITGGVTATTVISVHETEKWVETTFATVEEGSGLLLSQLSSTDGATLRLWAADPRPILEVDLELSAHLEDPATRPLEPVAGAEQIADTQAAIDDLSYDSGPTVHVGADFTWPSPPEKSLPADAREEDDVLFAEQGDSMHLPSGARTLSPTLPISAGTGGSFTVIAADDGPGAVRALLDEAEGHAGNPEAVDGPTASEVDGITLVRGYFNIDAGGWGFEVVSVQGPEDETATLYVRSWAD